MTDHCMGETGCACHPTAGLYPYGYPLVPGSQPPTLYSASPYAAAGGQVTLPPNASSLYTTSTAPYDFKDTAGAWRSAVYPAGYYTYDAAMPYPYGNGYSAINGAAHTKNATKEATSLLKSWLNDHMQNPYPTKGEKIMLAIITKMTLTQVSTWFANARRRLKKENKMTWSPRNRYDDDDDDKKDDDDDDEVDEKHEKDTSLCKKDQSLDLTKKSDLSSSESRLEKSAIATLTDTDNGRTVSPTNPALKTSSIKEFEQRNRSRPFATLAASMRDDLDHSPSSQSEQNNNMAATDKLLLSDHPLMKPRIWSIAETATSEALSLRPKAGIYPFLSRQPLPQTLATSLASQFTSGASRQWPWSQGSFKSSTPY